MPSWIEHPASILAKPCRRLSPLLLALAGSLFAFAPSSQALGHPDSPSSPPLIPARVELKHQKPANIVALFARERLPGASGQHLPRAARSDSVESLLPGGIDAVFPAPERNKVVVVGTQSHPEELRQCIQLLDVPLEQTAPDRQKVLLRLRHGDAHELRSAVLRLPGAGTAAATGQQLTLEGTPDWLHRALRQVIRAELHEPPTLGNPVAGAAPAR